MNEKDPLIGKQVGNYRVVCPLGAGAMGSVYIVEHPELGRRMAIKLLSPHLSSSPWMTERFIVEARTIASIHHPNVVEVYDFGHLEGRLYYMMELLEGRDLRQIIEEHGTFSAGEVLPFLEQICSALQATHERGIVHRDLKPENILVLGECPLKLKLIDFGIAKDVGAPDRSPHLTNTGLVLGTPLYLSPEQAASRTELIGPRTDIYALGVLLYRMLAGRPPFEAATALEIAAMHLYQEPPPLRELSPTTPEEICQLVLSCLRKLPGERPTSVIDLALRFKVLLTAGGQPLSPSVPLRGRPHDTVPALPTDSGTGGSTEQARLARGNDRAQAETIMLSPPRPLSPANLSSEAAPGAVTATADASMLSSQEADLAPLAAMTPAASAPVLPEAGADEGPASPPTPSPDDTQEAFRALLKWMEKRGDFPALSKSVSEVSAKAMRLSSTSASQLAESIMKDFGLSTKLLRLVNSAFYDRGCGRIDSIKRAVVFLGFEQVRMAALALTLFQNLKDRTHAAELLDGAIASTMSGEFARSLALRSESHLVEEAFLCSLFREVGKQMVLYCLPEQYREMQQLIKEKGLSEERAARHVFGITFEQISVGICKHWHLSDRITESVKRLPPGKIAKPRTEAEQLRIIADLSNTLCHLVAETPAESQPQQLEELVKRYGAAIPLEKKALTALLRTTSRVFEERYSSLLDLDAKRSRLLRRLARWSGDGGAAAGEKAPEGPRAPTTEERARQEIPAAAAPTAPVQQQHADSSHRDQRQPPAPTVQKDRTNRLGQLIGAIDQKIASGSPPDEILRCVLDGFFNGFSFSRVLLYILRADLTCLELRAGLGQGVDKLLHQQRLPVNASSQDLFSSSLFHQIDAMVDDSSAAKYRGRIPDWYRHHLATPSFLLYPLAILMRPVGLIYADASPRLPVEARDRPLLDRLRNQAILALRKEAHP